jgi:hypothetical protein
MWDFEVDLVSVGAGAGGLAGAIATVDAGGRVLIADPAPQRGEGAPGLATRRRVHSTRGWLQEGATDCRTDEFLASLAECLPGPVYLNRDVPVPTRVATARHDDSVVEPFMGARLTEWAGQCLSTPYGVLFSGLFGWDGESMRSTDGDTIEVVPIGTLDWRQGMGEPALLDWMLDLAREREIEMLAETGMERLVFEGGRVAGVVLSTAGGPIAVRARQGVTIAPVEHDVPASGVAPVRGEPRQVCLVGHAASRFARVELLSGASAEAASRPMCRRPMGVEAFLAGLHESRQSFSRLWSHGKVHRHPPTGQ